MGGGSSVVAPAVAAKEELDNRQSVRVKAKQIPIEDNSLDQPIDSKVKQKSFREKIDTTKMTGQQKYYQDDYQLELPVHKANNKQRLHSKSDQNASNEHVPDAYEILTGNKESKRKKSDLIEMPEVLPENTDNYEKDNYNGNHSDNDNYDITAETITDTEVDDAELSPLDILLQFIPYYGQGDPSNDAIVRSTLSAMTVEDIDSKDEYGNTLLLLACQYRCEDLSRIMLNKGANPSALNSAGACCLHFACYKESQSISIAKVLLQSGATPEVLESTYGCTPLHYCAGSGNIELCKMLLSHGAQINSADFYGYTCVDYAREARMQDAVIYLQQRLDQSNMQNSYRMMGGYGNMGGMGGMGYGNMGGMGGNGGYMQHQNFPQFNYNDWTEATDPDSGGKYYTNMRTGESIWEFDFNSRASTHRMMPGQGQGMGIGPGMGGSGFQDGEGDGQRKGMGPGGGGGPGGPQLGRGPSGLPGASERSPVPGLARRNSLRKASVNSPALLPSKAMEAEAGKASVLKFLNKHAPNRVAEVDILLSRFQGNEKELLHELCTQYNQPVEIELLEYQAVLIEIEIENARKKKNRPGSALNQRVPPSPIGKGGMYIMMLMTIFVFLH